MSTFRQDNFDVLWGGTVREYNIQLTMIEDWFVQVDSNLLDSLTLKLIDCHCKCQLYGELLPV